MLGSVKKKKNVFIFVICILLHTMILYKICDFPKTLITYSDELTYYSIARSLFYGQGIKIHSVPFQFQNLAYSYFLLPFFYISNSILRMHVITLANAFLMSLSMVPVWLICKELKLKKQYTWFVLILFMICPDMITAGTLMSENLYWVLALTAMYFCIKAILSNKKMYSGIAAICCYLAYFCKEVAICLALAYIAFCILNPFVNGLLGSYDFQKDTGGVLKKVKLSYKTFLGNKTWMNLLIFIVVYILCYLLFKKVLFREISNLYASKLHFSFLSDKYSIFYIFYGFFYYIVAFTLAFMIYPVLYPIAHYQKIGQEAQKAFFYGLLLLLGTIVVIILTITVREDLGKLMPRIHLRYIAPITGLLLPIFFKALSDIEGNTVYIVKSRKIIAGICILFWVIAVFIYKGVSGRCVNENVCLAFSQYLTSCIENLRMNKDDTVIFYLAAMVTGIGLGFLLILWNWFEHFKKTYFSVILFLSFAVLSVANFSAGALNLYKSYEADGQQVAEMGLINSYFKEHGLEEKNIMYVCEHWWTKCAKVYDTYFDGENAFEMSSEDLISKLSQSGKDHILISEMDFSTVIWENPYQLDTIDYFISSEELFELDSVIGRLEFIPEISGDYFKVYKNVNTSQISLPSNKFIEINFVSEKYNAPLFVQDGISHCEGDYSWTDGDKMQVSISVANTVEALNVRFYLSGIYNGQQKAMVYQGENLIFDGVISGDKEFQFTLFPINGDCSFQVYFPNAVSPYELGDNTDERKLALGLKRITFEKIK